MASQERKPRKENEKQLINVLAATLVSTALLTEVVVVDTSLDTFLFVRGILASINFELARTIGSCLVCFSGNDFKGK